MRNTISLSMILVVSGFASVSNAAYVDLVSSDPGLVSYWRFEGDIAAGVTLVDENGNANPGTYAAGISADSAGVVGQAALFSGDARSVVTIDNEENFDFELSVTVEAWIKTDEFTRGWQSVIGKGDDQWRLHRGCTEGCAELKFGTEDASSPADTPDTGFDVDDGAWHHIVAVFDGEEEVGDFPAKYLYIDGELITEQDATGVLRVDAADPPDLPVMIGGNAEYPGEGYRAWSGWIDEVAIYSRALSEDDVLAHFNADKTASASGDFDGDGDLDAADIDALTAAINAGETAAKYDLDGNGTVGTEDRDNWVDVRKNTYFGDSNLDGEFSSADFVTVFVPAKYETAQPAGWGEGDWNGDGVFDSADFVKAFIGAGYEVGPKAVANAVPEPSSIVLLAFGMMGLLRRRSDR